MADGFKETALAYHRFPTPGKISVVPTKDLNNQRDLALAYSPGVAAASERIAENPDEARDLTARGNLVAVISNGTAVLGLGAIGPLAAKPVMEGKGVLFKKFAGIDVFDIEIDAADPERIVEIIASLEPTFGGINLEDIKAPECFIVERKLRERMKIPVFHDDQHGTAICVGAAIYNGLRVIGKEIADVKLVASGAGAAALACLDLLVKLGLRRENVVVTDKAGVVYSGRVEEMDPYKSIWAIDTPARTLADVIGGADVFLGLSAGGVLKPEMVAQMAPRPIIMALANPTPEIMPEEARAVRPDAILATGRSDFPNQVNNVLCFPFLFRGALDVGATTINDEMKLACVRALADLAKAESSDVVARAYGGQDLRFGPEYLIPRPFDPRLISAIAPAVARAAMDSGVATRPISDWAEYRAGLEQFVYRTGMIMRPVFARAKTDPRRVVFAEGEDERVLRAIQIVLDEGLARPQIIGRRSVVAARLERLGLRYRIDSDVPLTDPEDDPRYRDYWQHYHRLMERRGVSPDTARTVVRTRASVIGALMVIREDADAVICGTVGRFDRHLRDVLDIIGLRPGVQEVSSLQLLVSQRNSVFMTDTNVSYAPTAEKIAEQTLLAAEMVRMFGIVPKVALLSHSSFGTSEHESARTMRQALELVVRAAPDLEVEGEMPGDAALDPKTRERIFPSSRLGGIANLLVMPSIDAANIAFGLSRVLTEGLSVGPILVGMARAAHVVTPAITVRGLVNMAALATIDAQAHAGGAYSIPDLPSRG
jgi:malate dehydrogenase (oxaloacetate-decarboxylating)(NADP+)